MEFDTYYNGLDFGFAGHPAAFTRSTIKGDSLYVPVGIRKHELTNVQLAKLLRPIVSDEIVFADCAEPKSIHEMRTIPDGQYINVHPVSKGKDSVHHGVMWMRNFKEIIIDASLSWLADEFAGYSWQTNKYGESLPVPIDIHDDGIDSIRYAHEQNMRRYRPIMVMAGDKSAGDDSGFGLLEKIMAANTR
jgi:phage terminase large subunit